MDNNINYLFSAIGIFVMTLVIDKKTKNNQKRYIDIDKINLIQQDTFGTKEYFLYYEYKNKLISLWHDIQLMNKDNTFNFICEIPKWTREKMKINTEIEYNPIKQDTINGNLRRYNYGDIMFNYGAFPQTWENPDIINLYTQCRGDNDPLDVIEIGSSQLKTGSIIKVKVLGIFGMIDTDETDWKIIAINIKDNLASKLNDIDDINEYIPGLLESIKNWLTKYNLCENKPENKVAFNGEYKNKEFALKIINNCYKEWKTNFIK